MANELSERWGVGASFARKNREGWKESAATYSLMATLLGITLIGWGAYIAAQQVRISSWPSTEAEILSFSRGVRGVDQPGDAFGYAVPEILYEYAVDGVAYHSHRIGISISGNYGSKAELDNDVEGYKPGVRVRCYYNPRNHAESYLLNQGVTAGPVILLVMGCSLLLLAFIGSCNDRHKSLG